MRAADTNILVRSLVDDDPAQTRKARSIIGQEPVFLARTVLLESEWVLRTVYGLDPKRVIELLRAVAGLPGIAIEDASMVAKAMDWAEAGLDFADALHAAASAHCESFLTFDKQFARVGNRLGVHSVSVP